VQRPVPGTLELAVCDNGSGGGGPFGEHAGMALMRQRAEEIGADIAYRVVSGGGTMVMVSLKRPEVAEVGERSPRGISAAGAIS
jgi:nitrate/nitrite-specific signal transduction histidine kinase